MLASLTGSNVPANISSCGGNQIHVVFTSGVSVVRAGYHAKLHVSEGYQAGQVGFCTSSCPCEANEGHCQSDDQCVSGLVCGHDNCKPELGYPNGTNCCFDKIEYCSQILSGGNGTWTLQAPVNNPNEKVGNVTCKWFIDSLTNRHLTVSQTGSETCGTAVSGWSCCTSTNPCTLGDGDCDYNYECSSGFICGANNCGPLFPSGFDCCELSDEVVVSNTVINMALHTYEVSVQF